MPSAATIQAALADRLLPDERVQHAFVCQIKRGQKAELGKSAAATGASVAVSVAAGALGAGTGVLVVRVPPAVWVVVTTERLLMFPREGISNKAGSIGQLTFLAPRAALTAEMGGSLMKSVVIKDASDSQSLVVLRFGVRRASARTVVAALAR